VLPVQAFEDKYVWGELLEKEINVASFNLILSPHKCCKKGETERVWQFVGDLCATKWMWNQTFYTF
jgi:hypothetical protein